MELRSQLGRWIASPAGILVSKVVSSRMRNTQLIGVNLSAMNFLQTATYNSYYHVSILGKNEIAGRSYTDIFGCSQERKDRLAERCLLPIAEVGDICIFHDTGAYGLSGWSEQMMCAEYLFDGDIRKIHEVPTDR